MIYLNFRIAYSQTYIVSDFDKVSNRIRVEKLTFADFLAYCGGLLDYSCMIELIYFATIGLFWKIRELMIPNAVGPLFQSNT